MSRETVYTTNPLIEQLNLPKDLFLGMPNIVLTGNCELYLENHRGILSYHSDEIIVLSKAFQIQIKGRGLIICSYSKDELIIKGYILSILFI